MIKEQLTKACRTKDRSDGIAGLRYRLLSGALTFALAVFFVCLRPAEASIIDCFKAIAPYEQAAKATELAAKVGGCAGLATGDPIAAMTMAGIMGAAVAGEFSTIQGCRDKIDSVVGQLIAEALLSLPSETLPASTREWLRRFAEGKVPLSFSEIISGVLPQVNGYIECGCTIAGAPGEFRKLAEEYADTLKDCGSFIEDVKDTILNAGANLGEGIHRALHPGSPGLAPYIPCPSFDEIEIPPEIWIRRMLFPQVDVPTCYTGALCQPGYVVVIKTDPPGSDQRWSKCSKACPEPVRTFDDRCYYADKWTVLSGTCVQSGQDIGCCEDKGQKVVSWGSCGPACPPPRYFETKAESCADCPENSVPLFTSSNSSLATCKKCPSGLTSTVTAGQCTPCPPGHVMWVEDQPAPAGKKAAVGPAGPITTGPLSKSPPSTPPGQMETAGVPAAPAPPGMVQNPLAPDQLAASIAGKCFPCAPNAIPKYRYDPAKSSLGICEQCPPGTSTAPRTTDVALVEAARGASSMRCYPLNCPAGYDPKNPHQCLLTYEARPVLPGAPKSANCAALGPSLIVNPQNKSECIACPAGYSANAARTACVTGTAVLPPRAPARIAPPPPVTAAKPKAASTLNAPVKSQTIKLSAPPKTLSKTLSKAKPPPPPPPR